MQRHHCPDWFAEPQLGIFIHWGLFSVPAFAPPGRSIHDLMHTDFDRACVLSPYAEWYDNALRIPASPTALHHAAHYGDAPYEAFRAVFESEAVAFDADAWAELFHRVGAGYVVFVAKHHDGYCLWPSKVDNPWRPGWNSSRDLVGELAQAVRARGMRFGLYYSGGLDWSANAAPIANLGDMFACVPTDEAYRAYAAAQLRELIALYRPSVLWNDIAWPNDADLDLLFADYRAAVPDGVINDRWFANAAFFNGLRDPERRAAFNASMKAKVAAGAELFGGGVGRGDFRTVEYGLGAVPQDAKWEACRGIGLAFGHNQAEADEDFLTPDALAALRDDVLGQGGNLLVNLGPKADASIPEMQMRALEGLMRV
jgi:alpha-L-fucosidase